MAELSCLQPSSYQAYSWSELAVASYRNFEFMKAFEDQGRHIEIERGIRNSAELTIIN